MVMVSLLRFFQDNDGERRKKQKNTKQGREYVGAAEPTAGGSLRHHKQREIVAVNNCESGVGSVHVSSQR